MDWDRASSWVGHVVSQDNVIVERNRMSSLVGRCRHGLCQSVVIVGTCCRSGRFHRRSGQCVVMVRTRCKSEQCHREPEHSVAVIEDSVVMGRDRVS